MHESICECLKYSTGKWGTHKTYQNARLHRVVHIAHRQKDEDDEHELMHAVRRLFRVSILRRIRFKQLANKHFFKCVFMSRADHYLFINIFIRKFLRKVDAQKSIYEAVYLRVVVCCFYLRDKSKRTRREENFTKLCVPCGKLLVLLVYLAAPIIFSIMRYHSQRFKFTTI